ncbi:MAG: MCE family protein, partial [Sciscionella sp.]
MRATAGRALVAPLLKITVFALVTALLTYILGATIANADFGSTSDYRAQFTNASDLHPGDDVRISGVKVGTVTSIAVTDRTYAEVHFQVAADRKLAASTTATVKYRNMVGQRYLALETSAGDPNQVLRPGEEIPMAHTHPALNLTTLFNGFKPLFSALNPDDVNKLSYEIIRVLQGEGGTVEDLLAHTASVTSAIADKDKVIGQVIDNLNTVLDTVNARGNELSGLIVQLQQLVSGLAAERKPIGDAITALGGLTNTTAGLLRDVRPKLKQGIAGLGRLSKN